MPHVEVTVDLLGAEQVAISGNFAYVSVFYPSALRVYDISVPSSPTEVGSLPDIHGVTSVVVIGPYAYVPWYDSFGTPPGGLKVIDVSTPSAPFVAGSVDFPDDWVGRAAVYRGYSYVVTLDGFRVIDVSTPTAPVEVGIVATPCYWANEIAVAGSTAWVACWEAGLRVLELSNPESPVEVGFYDPPEALAFVDVGSDHAVAANEEAGLLSSTRASFPCSPTASSPATPRRGRRCSRNHSTLSTQPNSLRLVSRQRRAGATGGPPAGCRRRRWCRPAGSRR